MISEIGDWSQFATRAFHRFRTVANAIDAVQSLDIKLLSSKRPVSIAILKISVMFRTRASPMRGARKQTENVDLSKVAGRRCKWIYVHVISIYFFQNLHPLRCSRNRGSLSKRASSSGLDTHSVFLFRFALVLWF